MKGTLILTLLVLAAAAEPLDAQRKNNPPAPPPDTTGAGTQDLPPKVCPADHRDGPLYADGTTYYGIAAQKIVEGFLALPHDHFDRVQTGTQNVAASSLRVLTDAMDYDTCLRLTTIITGGERSAPPPRTWVYFTAGGFYFVSRWKPAQPLSNYTTSDGHVMVYDGALNLLGAYAF